MRAAVSRDTTDRTIEIKVADGPLLDVTRSWHTKTRLIQVQAVTIRTINGETRGIKATGGLVLKSGRTSDQRWGELSWGTGLGLDRIDTAPEWVQILWREAPAGVTGWKIPNEGDK